ncbi:MAG: hypothetical protein M9932_04375 [Xanthobacteraceae bacterium]|nr:hypothetical protein [Xanthobacteraceae bacterium]
MTDDLVSRLRNLAPESDDMPATRSVMLDAAAEIEMWAAQALKEEDCREMWRARADAAESELSALRARVREVVGPFAMLEATGWTGSYFSEPGHDGDNVSILYHAESHTTVTRGHFRAARQLMEEVK